jgi:Uncharacterized protein conserved in bacteria (DUF2252)
VRGRARASSRRPSRTRPGRGDRIAISAYLGKSDAFDRAIASFAETYADQNERDFASTATPRHQFRPPNEPNDEAGDDQCDQEDEREHDPALSACRRVRFCGCQHNVTLYRVMSPEDAAVVPPIADAVEARHAVVAAARDPASVSCLLQR